MINDPYHIATFGYNSNDPYNLAVDGVQQWSITLEELTPTYKHNYFGTDSEEYERWYEQQKRLYGQKQDTPKVYKLSVSCTVDGKQYFASCAVIQNKKAVARNIKLLKRKILATITEVKTVVF